MAVPLSPTASVKLPPVTHNPLPACLTAGTGLVVQRNCCVGSLALHAFSCTL